MDYETLRAKEYLHSDTDINIHKATVKGHRAVHTHDFIEMGFVTEGRGIHVVNGQTYPIVAGDLFILNSDMPHELTSEEGAPLVIYNCIFQPSSVNGSFAGEQDFADVASKYLFHALEKTDDPTEYIKLTGLDTHDIKLLLDNIYKEYERHDRGFAQIIRSDLTKLLILVFRLYRSDRRQTHNQSLYRRLVVKNTIAYMRENYGRALTCGQLAERNYLSVNYFSKIFKEESGYSVIQMLQRLRIDAAKELLEKTIFTVDEIASRVGYSDLKHFYKVFHKLNNCTPGEYRAANQAANQAAN